MTAIQTNVISPNKLKLLERVRGAIRTRHYSRRTEEAYVLWIKRFVRFMAQQVKALGGR